MKYFKKKNEKKKPTIEELDPEFHFKTLKVVDELKKRSLLEVGLEGIGDKIKNLFSKK